MGLSKHHVLGIAELKLILSMRDLNDVITSTLSLSKQKNKVRGS